MVLKKNIAFRLRKIKDKNILIGDYRAFELNEVGCAIWDFLSSSPKAKGEITDYIANLYDTSDSEIKEDIESYLDYLLTINAVRKAV